MIRSATVLLVFLAASPLWALQEVDPVLQTKIDDAIRRGVEYLKKAESIVPWAEFGANSDELILLTLVHAGVSSKDANPFESRTPSSSSIVRATSAKGNGSTRSWSRPNA